MNMTKPKTKLSTKEREAYKQLSDAIGNVILKLGYNSLEAYSLGTLAKRFNKDLQDMQEVIKDKYGCKEIDFKNNKLIYEKAK